MNSDIALVIGMLFAVSTYLILSRSAKEIVFGLILLSNGVNLLLVSMSGNPDNHAAPILDALNPLPAVDPLPQALVLTAIVIGYGMLSLLIFLVYNIQKREGRS